MLRSFKQKNVAPPLINAPAASPVHGVHGVHGVHHSVRYPGASEFDGKRGGRDLKELQKMPSSSALGPRSRMRRRMSRMRGRDQAVEGWAREPSDQGEYEHANAHEHTGGKYGKLGCHMSGHFSGGKLRPPPPRKKNDAYLTLRLGLGSYSRAAGGTGATFTTRSRMYLDTCFQAALARTAARTDRKSTR